MTIGLVNSVKGNDLLTNSVNADPTPNQQAAEILAQMKTLLIEIEKSTDQEQQLAYLKQFDAERQSFESIQGIVIKNPLYPNISLEQFEADLNYAVPSLQDTIQNGDPYSILQACGGEFQGLTAFIGELTS